MNGIEDKNERLEDKIKQCMRKKRDVA